MHFQISLSLWELQVVRDWLCVWDIAEKSLNRLLLLLILKSSNRSCSVEKDVLKSFKGKKLYWSFFLIKLKTLKFVKLLRTLIFKNTYIFNAWKKIQLANEAQLEPVQTYMMEFSFFLRKQLKASSSWPFSQKSSIKYIWHGSKYAYELLVFAITI